MVHQGWALAYRRFSTAYVGAEAAAKAAKRGVWRGKFIAPWDWRRGDRLKSATREGDGMCDRDGVLRATVPAEDDALRKLLARALSHFGRQGTSGSMVVSRALVSPRLALYVSPVSHALLDTHASRLGALVLVVDPAGRTAIDPVLVTSVLGLTPTESHLAVSLALGTSIRDIAIGTGRSEGTVRWHTKRILTKLGISRQVELARLVLPLAEIPQSRR